MKPIKAGIIGLGKAGAGLHLPAYRSIQDVEIAAVCDYSEEQTISIGKKNNIQHLFTSAEEMFKNVDLDVVSICSPPEYHYEHTKMAAQAGTAVILEKPIFSDMEEADKIAAVLEETGIKFSAVHSQKFRPGYLNALEKQKNGEIGDIFQVNINWMYPGDQNTMTRDQNHWSHQLPGGRWQEMIAHSIYKAYEFVGPMSLKHIELSTVTNNYPWLPADEMMIVLSSSSGPVTIRLSANIGIYTFMTVFGSKAPIHIGHTNLLDLSRSGSIFYFLKPEQILHGLKKTLSVFPGVNQKVFPTEHTVLIREFIRYFQGKVQTPPVSWEEAYNTLDLVLQIGQEISRQKQ